MIRIHRHSNPILLVIIFACLITSSMPNGLIQAYSNASPSDGASNNQKPIDSVGSISNAKSVYDTLTMLVSSAVKSVILTVVDEAHQPPASIQKHVSDHNPFLVPTNLIMPRGVTLSILDADATMSCTVIYFATSESALRSKSVSPSITRITSPEAKTAPKLDAPDLEPLD